MISEPLIVIALCIVFYGAFSRLLSKSHISGPMVFMLGGLIAGNGGLRIVEIGIANETLEGFGELTLALILFADAASTNGFKLIKDNKIPLRLLLISLPLTVALGAVLGIVIFPDLSWQECALIAAILTPTDAALGYAVVTSKIVPERIRQGILVESGLNDGLALPAVLVMAALAFNMGGEENASLSYWIIFTAKQIGLGILVGVIAGVFFGKLLHYAYEKEWIEHSFKNLTSVGAAILIFLGAHLVDGNGFIAAFVGGIMFGSFSRQRAGLLTEFVEEEGQLFSLLIFFFFGAVLLPAATDFLTVFCLMYALLSLTIIRMLPTAIALLGARISVAGQAFIGWFGPRGLASILFLFVAVEHEDGARLSQIEAIVYVTVFLSVFLHGTTAMLFSNAYGNSASAKRDMVSPT